MTKEEKARIHAALDLLPADSPAREELMKALGRNDLKRSSDRRTDAARRILVGARIPRWEAEQYRAQAMNEGRSFYRWCSAAFRYYYRR